MEPMETPNKSGMMARLRNSKGFSLIEMAIVLVIIGIIIAAIIKGQDLMANSRAKQLVSTANAWKIAAMAYMDRNGKLPGVVAGTSLINDAGAGTGSSIDSIAATMSQAPPNPVVIGGQNWYFFFGTTTTTPDTGKRNVIVVCKDDACATTLSTEEVELVKSLDTAIDGSSAALSGQVRGFLGTPPFEALADATGGRKNGKIALTATELTNTSSVGDSGTAQWDATYKGAAWAFDKPF